MTPQSAEPAAPSDLEPSDLERFDRVERVVHWVNAGLFGLVMLTSIPLYIGSLAEVFGRRHLLVEIHVWAGVALPVPVLLALAGPWGRKLRDDLSRFNRWTQDDFDWLLSSARRLQARVGKFNAGQKLNAAFVAGSVVVMLATGSVMKWFSPFPNSWRTGATFVHDLLATAIFVMVAGHIAFAFAHVDALRASINGRVSRAWARRHAPAWLEESERAEVLGPQRGESTPRGSLAGSQSRRARADLKAKRSVIPPT